MLEFTAHCKVPMMFIAKVRIIPAVPGPSPVERKTHSIYVQIKTIKKEKISMYILKCIFVFWPLLLHGENMDLLIIKRTKS